VSLIPATPILPDFTAVDPSVINPLLGMSGLGCDCSEYDDSGNCLDPDPCSTDTSTTGSTGTLIYGPTLDQLTGGQANCNGFLDEAGDCITTTTLNSLEQSCGANSNGGISCGSGANAVDIPASTVAAYGNFPTSTTGWYTDASGNTIIPNASGTGYYVVTPSGTVSQTTSGTPPAQAGAYNASATSAAQAAAISNAVNQAASIAKIMALQPGEYITPQGTIGRVSSTGVAPGLTTGLSSSTLMLIVLAVGVLVFAESR
jgi:hypothetical protein